jgi:hypothetical protein
MNSGDGAEIINESSLFIKNVGEVTSEILVIDVPE